MELRTLVSQFITNHRVKSPTTRSFLTEMYSLDWNSIRSRFDLKHIITSTCLWTLITDKCICLRTISSGWWIWSLCPTTLATTKIFWTTTRVRMMGNTYVFAREPTITVYRLLPSPITIRNWSIRWVQSSTCLIQSWTIRLDWQSVGWVWRVRPGSNLTVRKIKLWSLDRDSSQVSRFQWSSTVQTALTV